MDTRTAAGRLATELGPVLFFFVLVQWQGIFVGTAGFMAAAALVALLSWYRERRLPALPLIGVGFAMVFGGVTILLRDPIWIVMRPTVYNLIAAAVLSVAALRGWLILKSVFGAKGLEMSDPAWRVLTWRLVVFLVFLGLLNEFVWRNFGLDIWVAFKVFAVPPLDLLFLALNWPFISRERQSATADAAA